MLCSTAIQHTFRHRRLNPRIGIAFFFFTFNDNSKKDASAMLRALVLQLSSQLKDNHALLSSLHDRCLDATPPDHELRRLYASTCCGRSNTYISSWMHWTKAPGMSTGGAYLKPWPSSGNGQSLVFIS